MRATRAHVAAALLFLILSSLMLWPLPRLIARAVITPTVPLVNTWIYDSVWHAVTHRAPLPDVTARQFAIALFGFPFRAAGAAPLLTHNLLLLLGFAFSGYGAFVLARTTTASWWAGIAAGIFFAFLPSRFAELADTPQAWSGFLPLALAALIAFARTPSWPRGVLLVVTVAMSGLMFGTGSKLLFPGFAGIVLALVGLIGPIKASNRRAGKGLDDLSTRRLALILAAVCIILGALIPARFSMLGYTGMALLAGIGAMKLIRNRHLIGLAIAALLLYELRPAPLQFHLADPDEPPVYRYLASSNGGAILELPMHPGETEFEYLFRSTIHHRRTVASPELARAFAQRPIKLDVLDELAKLGVTTIVVHADTLKEETAAVHYFLYRAFDAGKLRFVSRFDRGIEGDFVFELGKGDMKPFFGPQPLTRPVAWLDEPQRDTEVRGSVRVLGWALSPAGIRQVRVFVNNREQHVDAQLFARPDVAALYPWHDASRSGFTVDIPRGRREGRIDVDIEVTDMSGRMVRVPQRWFVWSK